MKRKYKCIRKKRFTSSHSKSNSFKKWGVNIWAGKDDFMFVNVCFMFVNILNIHTDMCFHVEIKMQFWNGDKKTQQTNRDDYDALFSGMADKKFQRIWSHLLKKSLMENL